MDRLTRKSDTSDMVWFIDCEHKGYTESGYAEREPCEMDAHHARLAIAKLAEYEGLEEQGKLLKLPCAVGDIIWDIDFGRPCGYEVTGFSFGSLNDDDWEEEKALDKVVVYYTNSNGSITGTFAVSEIGKSVFLIKEEAEAALKELERGKGT